MQKKRTIGILMLVFGALLYAYVGKTEGIYDRTDDSSEYMVLEINDDKVEQVFSCQEQYLDAVDIKCRLTGEIKNAKIKITIKDAETKKVLTKTEKNTSEIKNGKFTRFEFDRVNIQSGKSYIATIENTENEEDVSVMTDSDGTIIMKTVTERFDIETFVLVLLLMGYVCIFFKMLDRLFSK